MAGYIGSAASVVSSGAEHKKTFTITGATTSLTGLNYTVGKVHVFQNGVRLVDGTDYTATNGTTITLTVAAQSGDNVVVISQAGFQVADALLTTGGTMTGGLTVQGTVAATAVTGDGSGLTGTGSPSIDDNGNATAITIDSSENVGIGTTSPSYKLDVASHIQIRAGESLRLQNVAGSSAATISCDGAGTNSDLSFKTANTERIKIDTSGRVTKPYQTYFHVMSPGSQSVAANAYTGFTLNNEISDVGGNFANNKFTAPVTGVYSLTINVRYDNLKNNASYYNTSIGTSNRNYGQLFSLNAFDADVNQWVFTMNVIADMDAGDEAYCNVGQIGGSSGTSINVSTAFFGYLLG
jgi:hypothetical protein